MWGRKPKTRSTHANVVDGNDDGDDDGKVDDFGTDYVDDGADYYDEDDADDNELSSVYYKIISKMNIIIFPICSLINLRYMITRKRCRHVIHEHDHHMASCIFLLIV